MPVENDQALATLPTYPELTLERIQEIQSKNAGWTGVKVSGSPHQRDVWDGAPCEWSRVRGATHTYDCGIGVGKGTRPAKLLKTVLYVGVDEEEGMIVWERWIIRHDGRNDSAIPEKGWSGFFNCFS